MCSGLNGVINAGIRRIGRNHAVGVEIVEPQAEVHDQVLELDLVLQVRRELPRRRSYIWRWMLDRSGTSGWKGTIAVLPRQPSRPEREWSRSSSCMPAFETRLDLVDGSPGWSGQFADPVRRAAIVLVEQRIPAVVKAVGDADRIRIQRKRIPSGRPRGECNNKVRRAFWISAMWPDPPAVVGSNFENPGTVGRPPSTCTGIGGYGKRVPVQGLLIRVCKMVDPEFVERLRDRVIQFEIWVSPFRPDWGMPPGEYV